MTTPTIPAPNVLKFPVEHATARTLDPKFNSINEQFLKRPLIAADWIPTDQNPTQAQAALRARGNEHFIVEGTGATSALATAADGGGLTITTGGSENNAIIIRPWAVSGEHSLTAGKWRSGKRPALGANIVTGSAVTLAAIWSGFKLTNVHTVATDNDQFYFRYSSADNGGRWQAVTSVNNTDEAADTGVVVEASTFYRLWVELDENRVPHYFINGNLVHVGPQVRALDTYLPFTGVQALSGSARAATVRHYHLSRLFGT